MKRYIFVCAPYSPVGSCLEPNLGAASKIEGVLTALQSSCDRVILVNSAHNELSNKWLPSVRRTRIVGVTVLEITPAALSSRKFGKLWSALLCPFILIGLAKRRPCLTWHYNLYLFEIIFAFFSRMLFSSLALLEYEDSPWARFKRGPLKTITDSFASLFIRGLFDFAFVVNLKLQSHLKQFSISSTLLPGILPSVRNSSEMFNAPNRERIVLGYFGGFYKEKGLQVLLDLASQEAFAEQFDLVLVGSGPMRDRALAAGEKFKGIKVLGPYKTREEVIEQMDLVDLCVNPHIDLASTYSGVFPFKILEYLARGKAVITTPLPKGILPETEAIIISDFSTDSLLDMVKKRSLLSFSERDRATLISYLTGFTETALAKRINDMICPVGMFTVI